MESQTLQRLHAVIDGHVQGVGFRNFVMDAAYRLDLTGWVRNTLDGEVEVLAEGNSAALTRFLEALRKGPRWAVVAQVLEEWSEGRGEFNSFRMRSTSNS